MKHLTMMPDISSILYLALARKSYCNLYRFTMTMNEEVNMNLVQKAADLIHNRFCMFMCGFKSNFFHDVQISSVNRIQVQKDTKKLEILSKDEIKNCPARILVKDNLLSIEFFHALTDGYGAVAYISTLTAEYLKLRYQIDVPVNYPVMNIHEEMKHEEVADEYYSFSAEKPSKLNKLYAYQLPRENKKESVIRTFDKVLSLAELKSISKSYGVSPTAFLSHAMAESFMKHQMKHKKKYQPVRIMIPVNLRGFHPSVTFRNFIETIHVTMHCDDLKKDMKERLKQFRAEMKSQLNKEHLSALAKAHLDAQESALFKMLPRSLKYLGFKIGYAIFGESNSTLTFTNLGVVNLPDEMHPYVHKIDCYLSPRAGSPYNCAMIAYKDQVSLNFSSFNKKTDVEEDFFAHLEEIMKNPEI